MVGSKQNKCPVASAMQPGSARTGGLPPARTRVAAGYVKRITSVVKMIANGAATTTYGRFLWKLVSGLVAGVTLVVFISGLSENQFDQRSAVDQREHLTLGSPETSVLGRPS